MWTIERFNELPTERAAEALTACCAAGEWTRAVADARPYADVDALLAHATAAFDALDAAAIARAADAHPPIGRRAAGTDTESSWSRQEQAAAAAPDTGVAAELAEANRAYTERFGRVFLICATGRSAAAILAEAKRRLGNDDDTEAVEVARELRGIVRLRLRKLVGP
ncbi:MAG TPA: 2-oxo-4-hydroxy-4-carboxy-5-ureidoimidazoline decarboxylase [Stackebrandtia sp.]|uniref:2-oxo-4-hydroxy-4-carboxy-5-ureidoimidazoline decarboxylase n=1 Tax=Stackebrandtia sp. TaxID=2023065 RepID=UPI002D4C9CF0|nr:2-oxo-4-hydroxy-4-carboxy-5-ureidoimidazoline decarboxylase [Stackebrandtia sp.]HZE39751.1 2-oxo-4-hydroxy-4-carboxy-5-ureidoimidazoline decarboxylase [Stackebrandtia sp.]